jgi:hypothetical protein
MDGNEPVLLAIGQSLTVGQRAKDLEIQNEQKRSTRNRNSLGLELLADFDPGSLGSERSNPERDLTECVLAN